MLTAVFLHGALGEKYGKRFDLDVDSVAAAIGLLKANFTEFARDVIGRGARYRVWVGKSNIGRDELMNPTNGQDIHIVPVVAGAGGDNGVLQIIVGVVLVIVGVVFSEFGASPLIGVGVSMIVGGAMQYISYASIKKITSQVGDGADTKLSRFFNGPVNTTAQGNPVPVLYGRMLVGSQVISGGLTDEALA